MFSFSFAVKKKKKTQKKNEKNELKNPKEKIKKHKKGGVKKKKKRGNQFESIKYTELGKSSSQGNVSMFRSTTVDTRGS